MRLFLLSLFALSAASFAQDEAKTFEVAGLKFTAPAGWEEQAPTSAMRKAQFKVGEGEMVVFYFGKGGGGGTKANVDRWLGQFEEPKEQLDPKSETEEIADGKAKVTTVSAKGTFLSGPPFAKKIPKPGYALRGAILEFPEGPLFIKLTGPEAKVAAESAAFDKMVRSAFAK
jgi:hypothetical protein